jgi:hypothetical protein
MKKQLLFIPAAIFFCSAARISFAYKEELPDLIIKDVSFQQWDTITKGNNCYISVTIRNTGSAPSGAAHVKLYDLDLSYSEAQKRGGFSRRELGIIKQDEEERMNGSDDKNFDPVISDVPSLKPGGSITLVMIVKDHWVFDPDIDIEANVDFDDLVKEKKEDNNKKILLMGG